MATASQPRRPDRRAPTGGHAGAVPFDVEAPPGLPSPEVAAAINAIARRRAAQ